MTRIFPDTVTVPVDELLKVVEELLKVADELLNVADELLNIADELPKVAEDDVTAALGEDVLEVAAEDDGSLVSEVMVLSKAWLQLEVLDDELLNDTALVGEALAAGLEANKLEVERIDGEALEIKTLEDVCEVLLEEILVDKANDKVVVFVGELLEDKAAALDEPIYN